MHTQNPTVSVSMSRVYEHTASITISPISEAPEQLRNTAVEELYEKYISSLNGVGQEAKRHFIKRDD